MRIHRPTLRTRSSILDYVTLPIFAILIAWWTSPAPAQNTASELKAFPSAVGYGAYASRVDIANVDSVVVVSNLNASGAGSFAEAASANNRLIWFDTTGVITITSAAGDLTVTADSLYIAFQTSPGGIAIHAADSSWFRILDPKDIIMRGGMMSGGDDNHTSPAATATYDDALQIVGTGSGVYLDHMEIVHGDDESLNFNVSASQALGSIDSSTIAYSVIMETMDDLTNGQNNHSYNVAIIPWQDMEMTFWRNVMGQGKRRNLKFYCYGVQLDRANWSILDFRQNVIYNWQQKTTHFDDADTAYFKANVAYNYYKEGGLSASYTKTLEMYRTDPDQGSGEYWYHGNIWETAAGVVSDADAATYVTEFNSDSVTNLGWMVDVNPKYDVPFLTANQAYDRVLDSVGVFWQDSSFWSNRLKADVQNGTGGLFSNAPTTWTSADLPTLVHPGDVVDSDGDVMSDTYELDHGLNPASAADQLTDMDGNGYCNLEEYLEWLIHGDVPERTLTFAGRKKKSFGSF